MKCSERDGGQQKKFPKEMMANKKSSERNGGQQKKVPKEMVANKKSFNSGDQY